MREAPLDAVLASNYCFVQSGWLAKELPERRSLLSIMQLVEVYAAGYLRMGSAIQSIRDHLAVDAEFDTPVAESVYRSLQEAITSVIMCAHDLNLMTCAVIAKGFYEGYKKTAPTYHGVKDDLRTLDLALNAELGSRKFYFVPPERAEYFNDTPELAFANDDWAPRMDRFKPVISAFPSTEEDVREAGNCFALGRSTATVFHLMRVIEAGLKAIAKELGVAYTSNWGQCLRDIEKQGEQSDPFFKEAIAYLRSIKNVWRNPTMHIERLYSDEEAERILKTVETFMGHLSTRLAE